MPHTSFPKLVESDTYKYAHNLLTLEQTLVQALHVFLLENILVHSLQPATKKYHLILLQ